MSAKQEMLNGKVISNNCFFGNTEIEHVAASASVVEIGVRAFSNCKNLKTVKLNEGLIRLKKEVFSGCENLKEINIPDTLQSIGEWAFRGCKSLNELYIPESVTEICAESFLNCPNLTIAAKEGSFAADYAEKNGIPLVITCR